MFELDYKLFVICFVSCIVCELYCLLSWNMSSLSQNVSSLSCLYCPSYFLSCLLAVSWVAWVGMSVAMCVVWVVCEFYCLNSIVSAFELSIELFENCFQVFEPKVCGLSYIVSSFSSVVSPFYCPIDQNLFKIILHIFVSSAPRSKWRPSTQQITQKKQLGQYNSQTTQTIQLTKQITNNL